MRLPSTVRRPLVICPGAPMGSGKGARGWRPRTSRNRRELADWLRGRRLGDAAQCSRQAGCRATIKAIAGKCGIDDRVTLAGEPLLCGWLAERRNHELIVVRRIVVDRLRMRDLEQPIRLLASLLGILLLTDLLRLPREHPLLRPVLH